jgi:glycosidase
MKRRLLIVSLLFLFLHGNANEIKLNGIYPTNWWVGMKNQKLQLMLHGSGIAENNFTISYPGVKLLKVNKVENKNYVFLDLQILPGAKPGLMKINYSGNGKGSFEYEIRPRRKGNGTQYAQGVTASDFIYLIMPDRFSNGDEANDKIEHYTDKSLNRDSIFHRHGGDLQGVINNLDYLKDLGVTSVWLTPVFENNMPDRTEHGYAITNHYKVDERLGGNLAYKRLGEEIHKRGMKLIQDAVYNHVGLQHFFIQDLPMKDWLNQWPKYTNTTYKDQPIFDPYRSISDAKIMTDGWFTTQMPDLNQRNSFVANFLIQHAIWSVEMYGVDGWRIDTYIYNDLDFMNRCNKALMDEYPKITLFGETWVHGVLNQAYFTQNKLNLPFKSNLPGVTDFQTHMYGILPALTENFGWTEGVNKLYQTLANDYVYPDPMKHVIFLDNHDKTRIFSTVNEDPAKLKMAIGWLLTSRGIPQLYYGTEIMMKGVANPDGWVRLDFPGGWKGDQANKFQSTGRTNQENEIFNYTRKLANYRKNASAIKSGKLMQYVPVEGVYTYFRYDDKQSIMVIMNTDNGEKTIDMNRFSESFKNYSKARNIETERIDALNATWKIPGKSIWIMELQK